MTDLDVAVRLRFLALGGDKLKGATRDLQAFGKATNSLSSGATARLSGDLTKAWTASVKLGGALGKTAGAMGHIGREAGALAAARRETERLAKANTALGMSASGAAARYAKLEQRLKAAESAASRRAAGSSGRGFVNEAVSRVSPEGGYLMSAGAGAAAGAVMGSGIIGAGLAASYGTKRAIDFEASMADVKKKVTLPAGHTWAEIEASINKTALAVGLAREQVAALTAEAGANGIAFEDMSRFVMLAAKAAKGWDMAPAEAGEKLAKLKTNTHATISQLEDYADKINKLGDTGAAKERDILEAFLRSAGPAKAADVPYDTTLAVTSALNSIGMPEEVAARFFNAFSAKLRTAASGGAGAEKAAEGFKALGLSLEEVERGMKTDATKTMLDIMKRINESADKAAISIKLFGQEWWDEAARTGNAFDEVIKNLKLLTGTDWKGSLQQNLNTELETTRNHLDRIKVLVDQIGAGLMSWTLKPISDSIDGVIGGFEKMKSVVSGGVFPPSVAEVDTAGVLRRRALANPSGEALSAYEKRLGLDGGSKPAGSIVSLGRQLQAEGLRISEHPAFGGVHPVHHGRGHYEGRAIDVNVGSGVMEAGNPAAGAKFDALAARLRGQGYRVIWRAPGHYDHMHVETPAGFGRGLMRRRMQPTLSGGGVGGAGVEAAPGKQSGLGRSIHIGQAHFHGVKDVAGLHRQLTAFTDRKIRSSRDGALHDIG